MILKLFPHFDLGYGLLILRYIFQMQMRYMATFNPNHILTFPASPLVTFPQEVELS